MFKAIDKWLIGYLKSVLRRPRPATRPRHLFFCLCDHFEPFRGGVDAPEARCTVKDWLSAYPSAVAGFLDADGRPPCHTFFYPQEEYDEDILDRLAEFCRQGYGEVEIHLHHRHDTAAGLRQKLESFRDLLHRRHGLLGELREAASGKRQEASGKRQASGGSREESGKVSSPFPTLPPSRLPLSACRYGFIHGNWALCNSRPDGDWCGVNEELGVLTETGCYADFTFPSAPSRTQSRMVNAIYYATDTPGKPRAADQGSVVGCPLPVIGGTMNEVRTVSPSTKNHEPITGHAASGGLLLITGPLALNWARRKWGLLPRVENSEISGANPPTADRIRLWARQAIHVDGRPDWIFVKVHTHGCVPGNAKVILGDAMRKAHETLRQEFNDGAAWKLHYVSAREMYNLVRAAESGAAGDPGPWRDYEVVWPVA